MQALASVLKSVADKAPPFIKDYMNLTLDVFIKAEGAIKFFMNHGQEIIKKAGAIDKMRKNTSRYRRFINKEINYYPK
jgi:hypothetical protein